MLTSGVCPGTNSCGSNDLSPPPADPFSMDVGGFLLLESFQGYKVCPVVKR